MMGLKMVCDYGDVDMQVDYETDISVWHWKKSSCLWEAGIQMSLLSLANALI